MTRWEYRQFRLELRRGGDWWANVDGRGAVGLEQALNLLGREGWELVEIVTVTYQGGYGRMQEDAGELAFQPDIVCAILKRPLA